MISASIRGSVHLAVLAHTETGRCHSDPARRVPTWVHGPVSRRKIHTSTRLRRNTGRHSLCICFWQMAGDVEGMPRRIGSILRRRILRSCASVCELVYGSGGGLCFANLENGTTFHIIGNDTGGLEYQILAYGQEDAYMV